jgi:hypothetical protein
MNNLSIKIFFILFLLSLAAVSPAQNIQKNPDRQPSGSSHSGKKEAKIKAPKNASDAKKKQEASKRKQDKAYKKSIKKSQKRTYDIQSPEVKARMKQNKKNTVIRDKDKKKKSKANTRKAAKKYN